MLRIHFLIRLVFLIVFGVLSALPTALLALRLGPSEQPSTLGGVEQLSKYPVASLSTVLDGAFQSEFERWFGKHLGLRAEIIRTDNQLNFSIFRMTKEGTVLGQNNVLFEPAYIEAYNALSTVPDESLDAFASRLAELQHALADRGVKFIVMITPSKVALYPELLPDRARPGPGSTIYNRFLTLARQRGVALFDTVEFVRALKASSPYPVFPPGGAHWSRYVACKVGERFMLLLGETLQKSVPVLTCDPAVIKSRASGIDRDLARLANLWQNDTFDVPLPTPKIRVTKDAAAYHANLLFVGDSFLWPFFEALEQKAAYARRDFFYYYRSHDRFVARRKAQPRVALDREKLDWDELLARDAVVLELNEVTIRDFGYGFVDDALNAIQKRHAVNAN